MGVGVGWLENLILKKNLSPTRTWTEGLSIFLILGHKPVNLFPTILVSNLILPQINLLKTPVHY